MDSSFRSRLRLLMLLSLVLLAINLVATLSGVY